MKTEPKIIYEDEDILAIDKPAGLVVHADGRTTEPTVADWFVEKYPESRDVGEKLGGIERPGIVHRIDRETSGILLLAKTSLGHSLLKKQFQDREIEKVYHLFVYGSVKENHGTINMTISKSKTDFRRWVASSPQSLSSIRERMQGRGESREAETYYEVIKRSEEHGVTFVLAKPKTGRTHQIRVHFKALHHPIVCDKLYGGSRSLSESGSTLGFKRLALHAKGIKFMNTKGEEVRLEAPYPEDFQHAIDIIG